MKFETEVSDEVILLNTYIFYGDIYFFQNFLIKLTVLFLVTHVLKLYEVFVWKIPLAAAIGTIFEIAGLLFAPSYTFFIILVHVFEIPCIMLFLLGKKRGLCGRAIIAGYFFVMITNGVLEFLWNYFGTTGTFSVMLILACAIVVLGTIFYIRYKRIAKGIFSIEIIHGDRHIHAKAYYDSGNRLKDPYTGKGVHIASEKLIEKIDIVKEKMVCIPYHSLGNTNGLLEVYYMDDMQIHRPDISIKLQGIPIGVAKESLFQGKNYEIILNEDVW